MPIALATTIIPLALTLAVLTIGSAGAGPRVWVAIAVLGALVAFVFLEFLKVTREMDKD